MTTIDTLKSQWHDLLTQQVGLLEQDANELATVLIDAGNEAVQKSAEYMRQLAGYAADYGAGRIDEKVWRRAMTRMMAAIALVPEEARNKAEREAAIKAEAILRRLVAAATLFLSVAANVGAQAAAEGLGEVLGR